MFDASVYDLVIIGAGPSGLTAALYAAKSKLKFVVLAKEIGGYSKLIPHLKNYPAYAGKTGSDFTASVLGQLEPYHVDIDEGEEIDRVVKLDNGNFEIKCGKSTFISRTVLVATGRSFVKSKIKNVKKFIKMGSAKFGLYEHTSFKNQKVAVVGAGHGGLFAASIASKTALKVYLIERESSIQNLGKLSELSKELIQKSNVEIFTNTEVLELMGKKELAALKVKMKSKTSLLDVDLVIITTGYAPNSSMVSDLVETTAKGEIIVNESNMTNIPGVFASGDVTSIKSKQVVISAGSGANAVLSIVEFLNSEN